VFTLRPLAVLGLALALPLAAPAATAAEREASEPIAVATTEQAPARPTQTTDVTPKPERAPTPRSELRGRRSWDPGTGFRNPYAFPLQTVPIAVPTVTGFSF